MTSEYKCPNRMTSAVLNLPEHDEWRSMPDGTRTCSYCGSLHPDDFLAILYGYIEDPAFKLEPSNKGYKVYANRPGTRNASEGGIKFYTWHTQDIPQAERDALDAAYRLTLPVLQYRWDERRKERGW